jgi:hypothetical protein
LSCTKMKCCSEFSACTGNQECVALADCVNACADDACIDDCRGTASDAAIQTFSNLLACSRMNCAAACM